MFSSVKLWNLVLKEIIRKPCLRFKINLWEQLSQVKELLEVGWIVAVCLTCVRRAQLPVAHCCMRWQGMDMLESLRSILFLVLLLVQTMSPTITRGRRSEPLKFWSSLFLSSSTRFPFFFYCWCLLLSWLTSMASGSGIGNMMWWGWCLAGDEEDFGLVSLG